MAFGSAVRGGGDQATVRLTADTGAGLTRTFLFPETLSAPETRWIPALRLKPFLDMDAAEAKWLLDVCPHTPDWRATVRALSRLWGDQRGAAWMAYVLPKGSAREVLLGAIWTCWQGPLAMISGARPPETSPYYEIPVLRVVAQWVREVAGLKPVLAVCESETRVIDSARAAGIAVLPIPESREQRRELRRAQRELDAILEQLGDAAGVSRQRAAQLLERE